MEFSDLAKIFATLFVVIDPIGLTSVFTALTHEMSRKERVSTAIRSVTIGAMALLCFAVFGESLLGSIGISMGAFQIAGGILLLLIALDMVFERRTKRREDRAESEDLPADPSVFPLAIPLTAGPGAIASIILLVGEASGPTETAAVILMAAFVLLITLLMYLFGAPLLLRVLRIQGVAIVTRLLGMLLAALAVQFVINGLYAVLPIG